MSRSLLLSTIGWLASALLLLGKAGAAVLHVPPEYTTIQAAFDALSDGDTVLVEPGTYAEALQAPLHPFLLKGNTDVDSLRPVIDPTPLPDSDRLACLTLPGPVNGETVLEDMVLRNGAAMYPRFTPPPRSEIGGIVLRRRELTARRCLFDSTASAIVAYFFDGTHVTVEQCVFNLCVDQCIYSPMGRVTATDCEFGYWASGALVWCGDSSTIVRSHFSTGTGMSAMLRIFGFDCYVQQCVFGPADSSRYLLMDGSLYRATISNNVFADVTNLQAGVCAFNFRCSAPSSFRGNVFRDIRAPSPANYGYLLAISASDDSFDTCTSVVVDSNIFMSSDANAVIAGSRPQIRRNRIRDVGAAIGAAVSGRSAVMRENTFDSTGWAVQGNAGYTVDAQWNWWGDSTGPYHPTLNPAGLGDTVGNWVTFSPWYADTSFLAVTEPPRLLPGHYELTAYPNPFNNSCRIRLVVPQAQVVRLELYDLLGRRIRELWSGALALDKELTVDGSDLASGIYFIRAVSTVHRNRAFATAKLVLLK